MKLNQIPVPDVYTDSSDFRFFLRWFELALRRIQYDTENILDLYDPLKCPSSLLWMLADTMGFRYDDRFCVAFNRAVLLYFMSMIRNKGSKDGVALAAEVNLKQFVIDQAAQDDPILWERLEDTTIPVNSVSVTPHVDQGYIDVVYFSDRIPTDACIEYVRPIGMYMFAYPGVRFDGDMKLSVDGRLTNLNELGLSLGPTHVGHYRRDDYARMQRLEDSDVHGHVVDEHLTDARDPAWFRNSKFESLDGGEPSIDAGYRALYSLQLCNNEQTVQALVQTPEGRFTDPDQFFKLGYQAWVEAENDPGYNLLYNKTEEETHGEDIYTSDSDSDPQPAVNPPMTQLGDAISLNSTNTEFTKVDDGHIIIVDNHGEPVD